MPWPPTRLQKRAGRMKEQLQAARGDMTPWVPDSQSVAVTVPWWRDFLRSMRAVLLTSEPGSNLDVSIRSALQRVAGDSIRDIFQHGAALILQKQGVPVSVSISRCYPLGDGDLREVPWVITDPYVSEDSTDGRVDRMSVLRVDGTTISGEIWSIDEETNLDAVVAEAPAEPAGFGVALAPDDDGVGWGKALLDDLISPLVIASLAWTDMRWCCANFARPLP